MKTKLLALLVLALTGVAQAETYTATVAGTTFTHEWATPLELAADDTLVVTVNGNSDQSAVDWTGITGTGTIKFQGTGVVTLPGHGKRFAESLSVETCKGLTFYMTKDWAKASGSPRPFVVRNLSGSVNFNRITVEARSTYFKTVQNLITEWDGILPEQGSRTSSSGTTIWGVELYVASDDNAPSKDKALVISGNQTSAQTLRIESTGCVLLKGQWKGTIENNGLLIIGADVDREQFTITGSGMTEDEETEPPAVAATNELIVIAPKDLKAMWNEVYAAAFKEIHPGYTCKVVGTDEIYSDYSYDATNTDGKPRNPAESIHAFIRHERWYNGAKYFILGGPFIDAQNLDKVIKLQTGETLALSNAVPGIIACNGSQYGSCESDLYYACFDRGNKYAWDMDGDGEYLEADSVVKDGKAAHSTIPDVAVSRIPLLTWNEWKKPDGSVYSQQDLLTAYVAKLKNGLSADFDGNNRYGCYGYTIYESDNRIFPSLGGSYKELVRRDESEFYTDVRNMFDPERGDDSFWCAETISRRHFKEQIAPTRPIDSTSILWDENVWNKGLNSREEARNAFIKNNHALKFYYAHSNYGGGHGFSRDDFKMEGCGLTLMDDCAGPCSTGALALKDNKDGTYEHDISYAHASVMSPFGGSLATVNNTRAGFFSSDFRGRFDSGCSFELESHMIEAFVGDGLTAGDAWKKMVSRYAADRQTNSTHVWIYSEVMLQGDPLVKLPAVEEDLDYGVDGVIYKGIEGKTDAVVTMSVNGDKTIEASKKFKVMNGLSTSGSALTLKTGEGGIGGDGVTFSGEKGTLTLAGNEPFYVAGVKNGQKVVVTGKGATLDFDSFEISELEIGEGADVTIRSNTRGALAKIGNALTIPDNAIVRLATWDAFGDTKGTITVGADAKLIIEPNPSYHDGNNRGEALNAEIVFEDGVAAFDVATSSEAIFTGEKDPRVTYTEIPAFADELYYPNSATDWTATVRGRITDEGAGSGPIGTNTLVRFMSSYGVVYIHDDVRCSHISVENGANLKIGYWNNTWTIPSNWTVDIEEGSSLTIERWGSGNRGVVVFGSNIVVNGGTMTFGSDVTAATCDNISGTATISLPVGVTITSTGTIENPIVVPEGYELSATKSGTSTIYRAIQTRTIYWDSSTSKEWSSKAGMPPFVDEGGNRVSYQFGDTVVVRKTADNELWLGSVAEGVPFVIDGYAVQIENESKGVAGFSGSDVSVVNGGSIAYRSRWNGVKLKDSSIHLEKGTSFGPYSQWTCVVDIEGIVTFDGEKTVSFASEGAKLVTASSELIVPVGAEPIKVTSGIDNHLVLSESDGERRVYRLIEQSATLTIPEGMTAELSKSACFSGTVVGAGRLIVTDSPSATLKASLKAETWTGTFVLKGLTASREGDDLWNFDPSNYGHEGSQVELWNCKGFCANNVTIKMPFIITGEFCISDGYSGGKDTLSCLKGTGTIKATFTTMTYTVLDASEFYGVVADENVVILPDSSPSVLKKKGYLSYTITDGVVSEVEVTEDATPTISALTLGGNAAVTISEPIAGLTYTLELAETLDAEAWNADCSKKAEAADPLTLYAGAPEGAARFYRVVVSF